MKSTDSFRESLVAKIWQSQLLEGVELATERGEPIRIIYPGRLNDDRGADFRDAVIATSQGLIKGDIEVHVRSSDWQAHRHHRNSSYNRVILHVVMWHNREVAISLQNGGDVPTVILSKYLKSLYRQWSNLAEPQASLSTSCHKAVEHMPPSCLAAFLDSAGEERFLAKASQFQADLERMEPGQSLYQGIMGALGYTKNKMPFLELARRLPLHILESMTQSRISDEECLAQQQALLLGNAGLLPSQRSNFRSKNLDDEWVEKLERLWASSDQANAMTPDAWHLFKVRPYNHPVRRIVAISYLILRYREKGILEGLVDVVKETPASRGHHELERGLVVAASGYWVNHFDFGLGSRIISSTLLGKGRVAEIAVNVLLPFTFARSKVTSQIGLRQKAFDLYQSYPRLIGNAVERHMKRRLGLNNNLVNSAQRQQGLIHIYSTLCTQGRCNFCPLGKIR